MLARTRWARLVVQADTRSFSTTRAARADFSHVVIGAGVVGLATARQLAVAHPQDSTLLLERHGRVGTETSSRSSEVVHAGIYYGAGSLKTRLCVRGRGLLYDFCRRHGVAHRRTGKWIVAQDAADRDVLEGIHRHCRDAIDVPTRWLDGAEARREEPLVCARHGVLESPTTGIVDSHGLMLALHALFDEAGGVTALNATVAGVEPLGRVPPGSSGYRLTVRDSGTGEESVVESETVVNCAGLGAVDLYNKMAPPDRHLKLHYAKGNYFSYSAAAPSVRRLIYPVTRPGAAGLGTHLTIDLAGRMRFGPDVEWMDGPSDLSVNVDRLPLALTEIRQYLPSIDESALAADYAGIRPKLGRAGDGFVDFWIKKEDGFDGWVNLLGIESPGLTSCLAIGEMVDDLLYRGPSPT